MASFWDRNRSRGIQREIARTAEHLGVPPKAVNILYNAHFDFDDKWMGWVPQNAKVPPADLKLAQKAGVMFPPVEYTHAELLAWILKSRKKIDRAAVGEAFAASLTSRRMDTRSALGSYAHALHLEKHAFKADPQEDRPMCVVCSARPKAMVDLSSRNFRRVKWAGNVEQGDLEYIAVDLHLFAELKPPAASEEDRQTLARVLDLLRKLPAKAGLGDLHRVLTGVFPSTKHERQVVLEILGYAGVLQPKGWPSFREGWVRPNDRPGPQSAGRAEWQYPVNGWSGRDKVNEAAVKFWFPWLG